MTRVSQFVWPLVALAVSLAAVFALTWIFSQERPRPSDPEVVEPTTPGPPSDQPIEQGLMVEVHGVQQPADERPLVLNVLKFWQGQVCMSVSFASDWMPQEQNDWTLTATNEGQTFCRRIQPNETLNLKFVPR